VGWYVAVEAPSMYSSGSMKTSVSKEKIREQNSDP
jgi:hypothetical protein